MKQDSWQYNEEIDAVAAAEVVVSRVGSGGPCVLCAENAEHSPDEEVRTVWWWWTRGGLRCFRGGPVLIMQQHFSCSTYRQLATDWDGGGRDGTVPILGRNHMIFYRKSKLLLILVLVIHLTYVLYS